MEGWAWLAWGVLGLILEGIALYQDRGQTLSEWIWWLAPRYPLVVFLLGVLCGHFVWQTVAVYRTLHRGGG